MTLSYLVAEKVWRCTLCDFTSGSVAGVDEHLVEEHGLEMVWLAHGSNTIVDIKGAMAVGEALKGKGGSTEDG